MGKWLVKIGIKLQAWWKKLCCKWNWLISKLIIDINECPVAKCICKDEN